MQIIFTYLFFENQKAQLLDNVINEAECFSDTIKRSTKYDMQKFDRQGVHNTIESIGKQEGVEWIRIFDKEGIVMYSSDRKEIATMVDKKAEACYACHAAEKPLEKLPTPERSRIFVSRKQKHRVLGIINPIYNEPSCYESPCHAHPPGKKVLGVIDVALSLQNTDQQIRHNRRNMICFTIISILGIIFVVGIFIKRFISRPVNRLVSCFKKVAEGDLNYKISFVAKDEMGLLAKAFTRMTEDLKKADDALKEWGHTLEEKVEQKTIDLRKMQEHLINTERLAAIGQTVAGIAHYIKSVLSGLEGGIYVACDALTQNDLPEVKAGLEMLQRNVQRISQLVYDFLSYSKNREPEYQLVSPNDIVQEVVTLMEPRAKGYDIKLIVDLDKSINKVMLDTKGIHNSLLNLVSNAIDACIFDNERKEFEVKIKTSLQDKCLSFKISDNGTGMDEEVKEKLFSSFFSTKEGRGTGLGLLTTHKIIQEHKGKIIVETQKGKGSIFIIKLPIKINNLGKGGK